jgi:hypothetical protein
MLSVILLNAVMLSVVATLTGTNELAHYDNVLVMTIIFYNTRHMSYLHYATDPEPHRKLVLTSNAVLIGNNLIKYHTRNH